MLTNFYNILHTLYWVNLQYTNCWLMHLTYVYCCYTTIGKVKLSLFFWLSSSHQTIELLQRETPTFRTIWFPNRPDLNPVDCRIWGVMQDWVHQTPVRDVTDFRQHLTDTWNDSSQSIVDDAVDEWHKRLQACVNERGGHCEHLL